MPKRYCLLLLIVLATWLAPAVSAQPPEKILDYQRIQLENGLTVLLMEYHKLPLVYFELRVRGGASVDPDGREGLANLTAELLRQGTEARTAAQIAEELDFVGGSLDVDVNTDFTVATAEFLRKDLAMGLELLAEVVLRPTFSPDELERVRKNVLASILRARENPLIIANQAFEAFLYKSHPYGRPVQGTEASVRSLTRDDIVGFHRENYRPETAILAVVGDFTVDDMASKLTMAFGDWQAGSAGSLPTPSLPGQPEKWQILVVDKPDVTQTQIRLGSFGIDRRHPDFHAIQVANAILGGGFTSRLVDEIRVNRGLTYGVTSFFAARAQRGPFAIATFSKNATALETLQVALDELKKFRQEGATPAELEKVKNYLTGLFALGLQTPESLAEQMNDIEFYALPPDFVDSYQERVRAVTLEEANRAAREYFPYENLAMVVVTDAKLMQDQLEQLGQVTVRSYLAD
jgi:zinc protease